MGKNIMGFLLQSSGRRQNCVSCLLKMSMFYYMSLFYLAFFFFAIPSFYFIFIWEMILDFGKTLLLFTKYKIYDKIFTFIT